MVVLLHEVDDNVAVVARIVASITLHYITLLSITGIVQFQAK